MAKEIERKFLIKEDYAIPSFNILKGELIYQTYLCSGTPEIRLREVRNGGKSTYLYTIKEGEGVARDEWETEISKFLYDEILKLHRREEPQISKKRYAMVDGSTIDIYKDSDVRVMEMEFETLEEANAYIVPMYVERELTGLKEWKNSSIARYGLPKENKSPFKQFVVNPITYSEYSHIVTLLDCETNLGTVLRQVRLNTDYKKVLVDLCVKVGIGNYRFGEFSKTGDGLVKVETANYVDKEDVLCVSKVANRILLENINLDNIATLMQSDKEEIRRNV